MGSGGKSKQQPVPTINAPSFNTDPSAYRNMGYQQTPNTYTSQGKPAWMQGYFDDPSWGRAAADRSVQLTHEMLGTNGAGALNKAVYGNAPEALLGNLQAGGMPAGAVPPSMNPKIGRAMGVGQGMGQMRGWTSLHPFHYGQSYPDMGQQFPTSGQGG